MSEKCFGGKNFTLNSPIFGSRAESSQFIEPSIFAPDSVGLLIAAALRSGQLHSHVSQCWESTFSEPTCPMCLRPETDFEDTLDEDGRKWPMQQIDLPFPSCIKASSNLLDLDLSTGAGIPLPQGEIGPDCVQAAWSRRTLLRNRSESPGDKTRSCSFSVDDDHIVDVHFPLDFHCIRHLFDKGGHLVSALQKCLVIEPRGGKSKSKFVVSSDSRFMVKSVSAKEEDFLTELGPAFFWYYCKAVFQSMPTLLLPLLGMFTVRNVRDHSRNTYIIVHNISRENASVVLDLKGVGSNRRVREWIPDTGRPDGVNVDDGLSESPVDDLANGDVQTADQPTVPSSLSGRVLWDEDFRALLGGSRVRLTRQSHQYFHDALQNDTEFLAAMGVVDYSLFMAIKETDNDPESILCGGIIDFLRPYTWDKKLESVVKSVNANIIGIGSRISNAGLAPETGLRHQSVVQMDKAPTIIKPALYGRRFRTNIASLFQCDEEQ